MGEVVRVGRGERGERGESLVDARRACVNGEDAIGVVGCSYLGRRR